MCYPSTPACPPPPSPPPSSPGNSPPTKRLRAASQKIHELTCLESRLLAAAARSGSVGHSARADSYRQQASAVRRERERWTLVARAPTPPTPVPSLLAAVLCVALPLVDLFVAGGNAARRLSRLVFTIGVVLCGVVIGTSTAGSWPCVEEASRPVHWVTEFAERELGRKSLRRPLPTKISLRGYHL